jgi:hypothetical protein
MMGTIMVVVMALNVGISVIHTFRKRYDIATFHLCAAIFLAVALGQMP